ncbi:MAG: AraC family transcriptional regulator [Eubacteriales bacterium]|nr:AraC family transcriptional regulator [Eubacteriales bacterium]
MYAANNSLKIVTDEAMMETHSHGVAGFPFQYYLDDVWAFDFHTLDWHWHPELEFIYVRKGDVRCLVGGEALELSQGSGLFINSRTIHRFEAAEHNLVPNVVFSPSLLASQDSLIHQQYIRPVLTQSGPFLILTPEIEWQADVLRRLTMVFDTQEQAMPNQLETLRLLLEMWDLLYEHIDTSGFDADAQMENGPARLQIMMRYIHEHYSEPITLDDIAAAVFISKNSALQLFRNGIHISPVSYLIRYRLKCAAGLLAATEKQVSAIAEETGFRSAGYFCRRFRELFMLSPAEYRRRKRADNDIG